MNQTQRLQSLIERFRGTAVLVLGDVMMDEYIWGTVSRISPEAPVPILDVVSESQRLGGAANVIHNLHTLGAKPYLCSIIGDDATGRKMIQHLQTLGIETDGLQIDPSRPTTLKTRIIAHQQQVARLDRESRQDISREMTAQILANIAKLLPKVDGIIIEDYGKGLITSALVREIVALTTREGKVVAVDPKTNHFDRYTGVSVITPNHHEAGASLHCTIETHEDLLLAGQRLLDNLQTEYVLITRGEHGMSLFEQRERRATHVPTMAQEVYDVTGAGDTVIAALTLGLASGADPAEAVLLSNVAAGVVVGKVGTATVSQEELHAALLKMTPQSFEFQREQLP